MLTMLIHAPATEAAGGADNAHLSVHATATDAAGGADNATDRSDNADTGSAFHAPASDVAGGADGLFRPCTCS